MTEQIMKLVKVDDKTAYENLLVKIAELEQQIEKMKCCGNCACLCECGIKGFNKCKNYNKWELRR